MLHIKYRHSYAVRCFIIVILAAMLFSSVPLRRAQAAAGDLDPSFDNDGKVITDFGGLDSAFDVVIQPNGRIVTAGFAGVSGEGLNFALARYNTNGSLDPSFGTGGKVTTDFLFHNDEAHAIALQPDGKIVAAGQLFSASTNFDFALARYNANGSLDTGFGTGGKVMTDFFGGEDEIFAMALQPDGKIVVAGHDLNLINFASDFALARYNANGSLDTSFGSGGKVVTDFSGGLDQAFGLTLQPDGRIIAAGLVSTQIGGFGLARYNANGSLDSSFGSGGKVVSPLLGVALAVTLQPDGKIIAGGDAPGTSQSDFALVRYNTDGSPDASFGTGGIVQTDILDQDEIRDLALQPDGKIVASGNVRDIGDDQDFGVARYNTDGSLDAGFGSGGKITTDILNGSNDNCLGLAIDTSGRIIAVGGDLIPDPQQPGATLFDSALVRYLGDATGFDICIQDDRNGNLLRFNSETGDYQFTDCRKGFTLSGRGAVRIRACKVELQDFGPDRNLSVLANTCTHIGTVSLQVSSPGRSFTVSDSDITNNTCGCR